MGQYLRFNSAITKIIIAGDFILLNTLFIVLYYMSRNEIPESERLQIFPDIIVLLNVSYLICTLAIKTVIHNRFESPERIIGRLFTLSTTHVLVFMALMALLNKAVLPTGFLILGYCLFTVLLIFYRLFFRYIIKLYRKHGGNSRAIVYVGSSDNMYELYEEMTKDPTSGFRMLGYFNDTPSPGFKNKLTYLGRVCDVAAYLKKEKVEQLFCTLPSDRAEEIRTIIDSCENHLIRFYSVPNVRNYLKRKMGLMSFGEVPVLYIREEPLSKVENRIIKRAFDLIFSTIFLITLFPVIYIIIGTIIKISSPGPVIFKQQRSGQDGKVFWCYKFRSMMVNSQADSLQATKDDGRKTPFGNFLRRSSLDELPQFINVLKGEMSVVGPRPHMLKHTEQYSLLINKYMVRHVIKPGITGWAQVTGFRGETKTVAQMDGRVKQDIWYIENWSVLLDIRIILKTTVSVIRDTSKAY